MNYRSHARPWIAPCLSLIAALGALHGGTASAATISGRVVLRVGDTPTGGPAVTEVGAPFVNTAGEVGFVGDLDDGDHYVWVGSEVIWVGGADANQTLTNPEVGMDSSGGGNFVYMPDADGLDGIYTDAGLLAVAGQPAVGYMDPAIYAFHVSPSMNADGSVHWIAGIDTDADGDVDARTFYRSVDGTAASIEAVLSSGDMIGAELIDVDPSSIDNDYAFSEDGAHLIQLIGMQGDVAADDVVLVDGVEVLREGGATGGGDNWQNFDLVAINAAGNYIITGDTNGAFATDEFLAHNGSIEVREGGEIAGVTLGDPAQLRFVAISDFDQAVYAWGYAGPLGFRETVFFACDANDIAGTSQVVLTTVDDGIDLDGDNGTDFALGDLTFTNPTASRATGETQFVYVTLQLDDGVNPSSDAMIEVPVSCCGNATVNPFEDCDDGNDDDTDDCLSTCAAASCGDGFVWTDMEECDDGNDVDTDDCPTTCLSAVCGDGFVLDGTEECDDGNDDDTDACTTACTAAACGDGFVQNEEICDDGNDVDTDECTSACAEAACGDGFVQDGVEDCDDGNVEDDDVCMADCTLPPAGSTGGADTTDGADSSSGGGSNDDTLTGADAGTVTDSDTDGADSSGTGESTGGADDGGGCACRATAPADARLVWLGLGVLGLARGRRRGRVATTP